MKICRALRASTAFAAILALPLSAARADEGMWTFDSFPAAKMRADYGWAPDQVWLDKVRAAAVRLTGGCSASFVSDAGLILTNHHCVATCIEQNSTADANILKTGFTARTREEEKKCAGQQAELVTSIRDVSEQVKQAIGTQAGEAAIKARSAILASLESSGCPDTARTRCQVVSLYGGGQYKLYTYRKFSDVRLVWAPEAQAAQFGGDPDNFNFPRYSMDASFLRAYEDGKAVATPNHLEWSARAPIDGEATFVVGNPGSTQRLLTSEQLAFQRELALPITLTIFSELRGRLIAAMDSSPEKAREGAETLGGIENSLKVYIGRVKALGDPAFTGRLAAAEADLKRRSAGNAAIGNPWADIAGAVRAYRDFYVADRFSLPSGELFNYAVTLVRAADERAKPNAERLPGYSDSALPLVEKRLLDAKPIHPWLDQLMMEWSLSKAREYLGADDPQTRLMLGMESPEGLAERLVSGTRLADPSVRKALWEGGAAAIAASTDPMIVYARSIDANDRDLQKRYDELVDAPLTSAQAKLADARFAAFGDTIYPDATFTLRISYGRVQGWTERGQKVPTRTALGGTFDRATGAEPFDLPAAFVKHQARIDKKAAYNFVTTNDIIGGNSGSPVIDRSGKVIGAAFDGNIHSLGGNYGYDATLNRTVVVSTDAIQEALEKIYPAPHLVAELRR
ncbi:S46 family peptidase [Sphingomonas xanthus]|uniref:Dipeptidyl-peptidase n=1 Tax=Sphingomonas xanthus TaxID=2594473 RepID=A0A516IRG0_9SPHN|nr:S46 family peptidase [Sphingomonas xanthus]QDP19459.1 S46 family peptidase [Sphingomonas xanthus]